MVTQAGSYRDLSDELQARLRAQFSPVGWMKHCRPRQFVSPLHVQYLDRILRTSIGMGGARLKFELPPRHGKTFQCNIGLGAWYLGKYPDREVATCSVAAQLASKNSSRARGDMRAAGRLVWGLEIDPERDAKHDWGVRRLGEERPTDGGYRAYGVGSQIHGDGAHLAILDDLLGGSKAARSQVQKDAVWDWVVEDLLSRTYPESDIVSIMTRWAEDDPHGRMDTDMPEEGWVTIRLPAIAEDDDMMGREPGEPLWPDQRPLWWLEKRRGGVPPRTWNSTYQQRPAAEEGDIWKAEWWAATRYAWTQKNDADAYALDGGSYVIHKSSLQRFTVVDLAFSEKKSADYTVVGTFGLTPEDPPRLLILDIHRERLTLPKLWPLLEKKLEEWGSRIVYMERDGQQIGIIQQAASLGFPVMTIGTTAEDAVRKDGDKESTAHAATPLASNGRLWVPRSAQWMAGWQSEMLTFPNAAHDDQADVTAWACLVALDRSRRSGRAPQLPSDLRSRVGGMDGLVSSRGGLRDLGMD